MGLLAGMIAIDLRTSPCNAVLATAFLDLDDAAAMQTHIRSGVVPLDRCRRFDRCIHSTIIG
jgi:hypothetical protein